MERIQSAIQKARTARAGRVGANPDAIPTIAAPQPVPGSATNAAWEKLEAIQIDRQHLARGRIVTLESGSVATPFDVMRTRLIKQMRANGWRRLSITSPGPTCGKTTTCLNLAFSLARQLDLRTMVIEVDLRKPSMARMLGLSQRHSFADVLAGRAAAEDNLVRYGTNLAFGTNRGSTHNSAELLQSGAIVDVLVKLEETYAPDLIIFDLPPMQVGDDAIAFLERTDCALLIAAAGTTTIAQVDHSERDISAHTNVLGVILNKCRYLDRDEAYGYDY
jgi:protein-tyrosine kinase